MDFTRTRSACWGGCANGDGSDERWILRVDDDLALSAAGADSGFDCCVDSCGFVCYGAADVFDAFGAGLRVERRTRARSRIQPRIQPRKCISEQPCKDPAGLRQSSATDTIWFTKFYCKLRRPPAELARQNFSTAGHANGFATDLKNVRARI